MKQIFKVGDTVYEKSSIPKWRRKRMIIKSVGSTGLITCYVIPKFDEVEMTERNFADWMLEKTND